MIKVIVMALLFGTVSGVGIGSYVGQFDLEGMMMGVLSITCIAIITSVMFFVDKKRAVKGELTHLQ